MPHVSREVHLVARPQGMPQPGDFRLVERELPDAGGGQVVVRNLLMSVDPYMRPRLAEAQALDTAMDGGAIGRVVQSRNPAFAEGDIVRNGAGLPRCFVSDGRGLQPLKPDPALPLSVYMHALGGTGFTAYGGLLEIGELKDGEQVFVSTAAGAVGSVVAQIAKIKGCYVVGSTGADDKVALAAGRGRHRRRHQLQAPADRPGAGGGHAQGHRRLFRQRRRRPPRRGAARG